MSGSHFTFSDGKYLSLSNTSPTHTLWRNVRGRGRLLSKKTRKSIKDSAELMLNVIDHVDMGCDATAGFQSSVDVDAAGPVGRPHLR